MNLASWIILGIVITIVLGVLYVLFKNNGKGCSCCKKDCVMKKSDK